MDPFLAQTRLQRLLYNKKVSIENALRVPNFISEYFYLFLSYQCIFFRHYNVHYIFDLLFKLFLYI